jgi:hypothetical protein
MAAMSLSISTASTITPAKSTVSQKAPARCDRTASSTGPFRAVRFSRRYHGVRFRDRTYRSDETANKAGFETVVFMTAATPRPNRRCRSTASVACPKLRTYSPNRSVV